MGSVIPYIQARLEFLTTSLTNPDLIELKRFREWEIEEGIKKANINKCKKSDNQ
jgi:hypothetical protein